MRIILYLFSFISAIICIYEFSWLGKSALAPILLLLSGMLAVVFFYLARKEKRK